MKGPVIGIITLQCVEARVSEHEKEVRVVVCYQGSERQSSLATGPRPSWNREPLQLDVRSPVTDRTLLVGFSVEAMISWNLAPLLAQSSKYQEARLRVPGGWLRLAAVFDMTTPLFVGDVVSPSGCYPWDGPRSAIVDALALDRVLVSYPHLGATCRVALPRSAVVADHRSDRFDDQGDQSDNATLQSSLHIPPIGIPVRHLFQPA